MMMLLYVLFSILSAHNARGAPVGFDLAARDEPLSPEACKNQLKRTLFGIIWACLSTTILCAWTAVHPNVPPRRKWKMESVEVDVLDDRCARASAGVGC